MKKLINSWISFKLLTYSSKHPSKRIKPKVQEEETHFRFEVAMRFSKGNGAYLSAFVDQSVALRKRTEDYDRKHIVNQKIIQGTKMRLLGLCELRVPQRPAMSRFATQSKYPPGKLQRFFSLSGAVLKCSC